LNKVVWLSKGVGAFALGGISALAKSECHTIRQATSVLRIISNTGRGASGKIQ
jgi:hypothetical protein